MNFQVGLFDAVWVFWLVVAAMVTIAISYSESLAVAAGSK
jgi:hypothetical protein